MSLLVDRYEILRQLGKKAGRQTLLARDGQTEEQVVIKRLSFSNDISWDDLKLFEREAETLRSLSHPALPRYLDSFEFSTANSKGFAFVQSYIEAPSLEDHLNNGRTFSETDVQQLMRNLLDILIYLHDRQPPVIHRDIKPSNILLGDRTGNSLGQVHLVDFGSVQTLASREGKTMTVVGTYGYMPPEQFGGIAHPASDLYSLGATAIALLTGTHPADLSQTDLQLQFETAAEISPTFAQWLHCITHPSLDQRFSSAREALVAIDDSQWMPLATRPGTLPTRPVSTIAILGNAVSRSALMGLVAAIIPSIVQEGYDAVFSHYPHNQHILDYVPREGIQGIGLGIANGLLVGIITRIFFNSLQNPRRYRRVLSTASLLFSVWLNLVIELVEGHLSDSDGSLLSPDILLAILVRGAPMIVLSSTLMTLVTQSIARWYERKSRESK